MTIHLLKEFGAISENRTICMSWNLTKQGHSLVHQKKKFHKIAETEYAIITWVTTDLKKYKM